VSDAVAALWPEALPPPNKPGGAEGAEGAVAMGPWLEVEIAAAVASVAAGPSGRSAVAALSSDRFQALWRGVANDPASATSSEWLCDYACALANAGFHFTSEQVAEVGPGR
jgi:hypothetical protein